MNGPLSRLRLLPALLALAVLLPAMHATSVQPPSFENLVNDSDYIVRAVVKSLRCDRFPAGSRTIVTYVELEVTETIAGRPPSPLVLRVIGGQIGDEELVLEGAPQFHVGDDNVLFIRGNGQMAFPLVAIMHGVYPVVKDEATGREYMVRADAAPLQQAADVARPMHGRGEVAALQAQAIRTALSPAQFRDQIRAAVQPGNTRLHEK